MCCDSLLPWLAVLHVNVSCVVGSLQRDYWILRWRAQAYNTAYATRRTEDKTLYFLVQPRVLGVPLISLGTAIGARVKFAWPRAVTTLTESRPTSSIYKPTAVVTAPAFPVPTSSAPRLGLAVPQFATSLLLMTTTTPSTRSADPHSDPRMTEAKQTRHTRSRSSSSGAPRGL